jgi:hypothetical protein
MAFRAHIRLLLEPHAGAWLQALPSHAFGNAVPAAYFRVMLQRRLRMTVFESSSFCPMCDGVCDTYGDHCLVCPCGGDRTLRHNQIRNAAARFCAAAGLRPVVEKPNLLRPRPCIDGADEAAPGRGGPQGVGGRRPADVYIPLWCLGKPAALDFAVSSGLRIGFLDESARKGSSSGEAYAALKRGHLDTAALCAADEITFIPMVCEAHGGSWGAEAQRVWQAVAKTSALLTGESAALKLGQLTQSLSVTLHRANARAVLAHAASLGGV